MTPEQIADRDSVWARMAVEHPEFTRAHDAGNNYHAVREIVLSGSVTWAATNGFFQPCEGKLVMDVGANTGVYSAYCGIKGAQVVAYEPFPEAFLLLATMVASTGLADRVEAINAAIATYTGYTSYLGHKTPNEDVTCYNGGIPTNGVGWTADDCRRALIVPCFAFEDALGDRDWDMVKMDIEGAEFELLLVTPVEALKRIKFMYAEFHDWVSQSLYEKTMEKLEAVFTVKTFRADGSRARYECAWCWRKK